MATAEVKKVKSAIAKFIFGEGLARHKVDSPFLAEMCTALVKFGSTVPGAASMKIVPTRYQLT